LDADISEGVHGGVDFIELFAEQDSLYEGDFTFLALLCLLNLP
jgi:hypothetical protein